MHRWGGRYEHYCRPFVAAYEKTKAKKVGLDVTKDDSTLCPLDHAYDADIHDAIAHLRILDGSLPEHPKHGRSVNCFADVGQPKYWVKSTSPAFGFFFYYTLDKAVCPFLSTTFGMPIWHPSNEAEVDTLFAAQVDVYVSQLRSSCSSLVVAAP